MRAHTHTHTITDRFVQQVEPVVQVIDESEGIRDVVSLRAEQQQHRHGHVLTAAKHRQVSTPQSCPLFIIHFK